MKLTFYDYSFIVFLFFFVFLVYCETCIITPTVQQLKCEVCQCLNPNGFPKVCLELDQFLEEQFSKEYALRRDIILNHEFATMCMHSKFVILIPVCVFIKFIYDVVKVDVIQS